MKAIHPFGARGAPAAVGSVCLLALTGAAYGHGAEHNPTRHQYLVSQGIPEEYAGLLNPLRAAPDLLATGKQLYADNCALCHGDSGDGRGEAAADLQPAPATLAGMFDRSMTGMNAGGPDAHLMHGVEHHHPGMTHAEAMGGLNLDAYMFWAVSEGGMELGSAMPAFKDLLTEEERWQILLYVANDLGTEAE